MNADDRARFDELEARLNKRDEQIDRLAEMMVGAVQSVTEATKAAADASLHMSGLKTEIAKLNDGMGRQQDAVVKHMLALRNRAEQSRKDIEAVMSERAEG